MSIQDREQISGETHPGISKDLLLTTVAGVLHHAQVTEYSIATRI